MGLDESVTNEEPVLVMLEDNLFLQKNTSYTIDCCGNFVTVKLTNVLVTLRTEVVALVLVKTEVEFCSMLYDRHIE